MVTWVMGGRVSDMGHKSTSPINIRSFFHIARGRVDVIFRTIFTSAIINTYITPLVTIITTSISPTFTIIETYITSIGVMTTISYSLITTDFFSTGKEETDKLQNLPLPPGLWEKEWMV